MILSINPGSSSIKYKLFDASNKKIVSSGDFYCERDGVSGAIVNIFSDISAYIDDIKKIAVRVVHGGERYSQPVVATKEVLNDLSQISHLAPLHNPIAIETIEQLQGKFKCPVWAVFDTAFFSEMPMESVTYALPLSLAKQYGIRKYGFHGISHRYVSKLVDKESNKKIISIHLGAGCSISGIVNGKPIITSMGMTPDEGLVMRSRSGDLDPGIVLYLAKELGVQKAKDIIENESGLLGLTEITGDMWDVLYLAGAKLENSNETHKVEITEEGRKKAESALKIYCNRVKHYIGAYSALIGGVDKIVFTGKIGFASSYLRDRILESTKFLAYEEVLNIEPNEELAIAQEIEKLNG